MSRPTTLEGDALTAAREAAYWELLVPACERISSGRPPEEDPEAQAALHAALMLQRRLGFPGEPDRSVHLSLNEVTVIWRAARSWAARVRQSVRDGRERPRPDGATSAPLSEADLRRFGVLSEHLAGLLGR